MDTDDYKVILVGSEFSNLWERKVSGIQQMFSKYLKSVLLVESPVDITLIMCGFFHIKAKAFQLSSFPL